VRVLPPALRSVSPRELAQRIDAERRGLPFLLHLDGDGRQRIVALGEAGSVSIGRAPSTDVPLGWDHEVSRLHAVLERDGGVWTIADEGLSRNGSFVNGRRLRGRQRLRDGDAIKIGGTLIVFVDADGDQSGTTTAASQTLEPPQLSDAQLRVLASLCGPLEDAPFAGPRSNREIAEDLYLSVETVKTHLRALFDLFAVGDLPQNRKRAELVRRAFESGVLG
jgi:pSer/pThr/pTyr-binding forkhead associated (FHA) protein